MIRASLLSLGILLLAAGCGDDDGGDDGGVTPGADADTNPVVDAAPGADAPTGDDADVGLDAAAGVPSYSADIQPFLMVKCGPCHTVQAEGGFNHASSYADTQEESDWKDGLFVYEAMLISVEEGGMPEDAGCSGDPVEDADNPACLTAAEHDLLRAWVEGGAPP